MTQDQLEAAAFWDAAICLDCGAENPEDAEVCEGCEGEDLLAASRMVKVAALLGEGE